VPHCRAASSRNFLHEGVVDATRSAAASARRRADRSADERHKKIKPISVPRRCPRPHRGRIDELIKSDTSIGCLTAIAASPVQSDSPLQLQIFVRIPRPWLRKECDNNEITHVRPFLIHAAFACHFLGSGRDADAPASLPVGHECELNNAAASSYKTSSCSIAVRH